MTIPSQKKPKLRTKQHSSLPKARNDENHDRIASPHKFSIVTMMERPVAPLEPEAPLVDVVSLVKTGPWQFIQLRGDPLDERAIDHGDVDLLGTPESVLQLLSAAFDWVQSGNGHIFIKGRNSDKLALSFVSPDANSRITFDLWVAARQLNDGKTVLTYADCAHLLPPQSGSIRRLPPSVEAGIYVHHLNAKKKALDAEAVVRRLGDYRAACLRDGETTVAQALDEILRHRRIDAGWLDTFTDHIAKAGLPLATMQQSTWSRKLADEFVAGWLDGPRPVRYIAITGGDGSGKSTLSRELRKSDPIVKDLTVGKRLYRNSLLYKILVIVARPLLGPDKSRFDDWVAPFAYARAACSLRVKTWLRRKGLGLIDRSLVDFLVVDRKTDNPKFHAASWLASIMGARIPVVHLTVPRKVLQSRKDELTELGQQKYDRLIFDHFSRRRPTTYALFFNGMDLRSATDALSKMLRLIAQVRHA